MSKLLLLLLIAGLVIAEIFLYRGNLNITGNNMISTPAAPTAHPGPHPIGKNFSWESLKYISTVDWPPKAVTFKEAYSCTSAGQQEARAGKTEERTVEGKKYCVTEETEGAAGSVYHTYAYKTSMGQGNVVIMTFSIRQVQCGNYPQPQMGECQKEQSSFDIDTAISPELRKL